MGNDYVTLGTTEQGPSTHSSRKGKRDKSKPSHIRALYVRHVVFDLIHARCHCLAGSGNIDEDVGVKPRALLYARCYYSSEKVCCYVELEQSYRSAKGTQIGYSNRLVPLASAVVLATKPITHLSSRRRQQTSSPSLPRSQHPLYIILMCWTC